MKVKRPQTLEELEKYPYDILVPADVAGILKCDQYSINVAARDNPERLGFPVTLLGNRVKIPKLAFIKFMKGEMLIENF